MQALEKENKKNKTLFFPFILFYMDDLNISENESVIWRKIYSS